MSIISIGFLLVVGYGVVALILIPILRSGSKNQVLARLSSTYRTGDNSSYPMAEASWKNKAYRGTTFPQMASFVLSCLLAAMTVIIIAVGALFFARAAISDNEALAVISQATSLISLLAFGVMFLLIPLTPITIIVNAFWVYNPKLREAEAESLAMGKGGFVKTQRILATYVWVFYTLCGLYLGVALLLGSLGFSY